ncbi:unnamed protein product [Trypanosoma congolense IL3000]|uniref:WGS project CAEQ00000000 data, annotated contig 59 n=1 Tax=Trypanosoma congolense (strain IL3000) TaxID=1068625 RepID=F9WH51_TRYCI|nr:unnamed protein product [Trypanosoma congolense IL3000]
MSSLGTCEEPAVSAARECGLWQTAESVEVRSDFPWVVVRGDDATGSGTNNSDDVEEELPVQTFLKDLIGCSRRVGHVCEVGMDLLSSGSCDHAGQCQISARFDGAGYLTLCFGSGWHPASKHFLTRLKRLWLAAKGAPVSEKEDECESGREDSCDVREALCWRLGNSDLNAFTAGAGGFCGSLGINSWGNEAVSDAYTSLGVLEADSHGAVSRSFPEIPLDLPRNELVFSQSPVEVVPDLHASASVTQDEVKVAKQQSKPHQFQVLFVSCDFEEAQMKSLLCSMPTSWLCVSPLFGPQSQRLVKACVEFFNVRVFPRLISVKVSRPLLTPSGDDHGEPVEGSVANARFSVVHMHGERLVLRGDGVERLFSECEYEDIACSKAADATTRGGVFFGTCSVAGPCRPPFPRLPSQGTLVQSQLKPVIESLLAEGGSLFALCCIGSISSGVYKECAGALHEAAAWWYEESQRHTDNVSMCDTCTCLLEKATRGVTTEALCATAEGVVDPESGGDRHTQRQPSDQFAQCADMGQKFCATACPLGSTLEDFPSACPLQSPVYFVDAISRVRARAGGDVARPVEEGVSNCSAAQHCAGDGLTMEDELLLQEHIISEVLEASEHLLPSTEGEPFLVYLRWPERQVDVLRRMQDVELPAATVVSVGSTRNTTQPLGPAVEAVGLHSEVPAACHEPDEPPAETSHDSPLCSPSLVKSFILRCHMKRGGNRATSLC